MSTTVSFDLPITKTDAKRMLVFGFANVAVAKNGKIVVDLHDDIIPEHVLEDAAYNYVLQARVGGFEHKKMGVARLIESVFLTAEKIKAMGLDDKKFKGAAWWVAFKVDDPEVWAKVEDETLVAFSIGGTATVEGKG